MGVYPALKRALEILSDYARVQLADESITVLVVLPYITVTKFSDDALGRRAAVEPDFNAVRRNTNGTATGIAVNAVSVQQVNIPVDLPRFTQPVITEDFRISANSFGVR